MKPLLIAGYAIVAILLHACGRLMMLLRKAHRYFAYATAIKRGSIVLQTEHKDKPKGPWVIATYNYDDNDYQLVKAEFFNNDRRPDWSKGECVYVYGKYMKVIRQAEAK